MSHTPDFPISDPFGKVHPLFWPVLMWNLWRYLGWLGREQRAGRGNWPHHVQMTSLGVIRVVRVYRPARESFAAFKGAAERVCAEMAAMPSWFAAQGVIPPFVLKFLAVSDSEVCALLPIPDI